MATSSYIQISKYALLEYIYTGEIISTTNAKTFRLYNAYSDEYQFLNSTQSINLTANVLDNSAVRLGQESSKWGYLDMDTVAPLIQIDANLQLVDVTANLLPNIKYDRVKLHFLSGYDFPGIDGVILQMGWDEWEISGTGGRNFSPASQVYIKGDSRIDFSTIPLFVGDRFYDRYIEFAIPSLADANFDFWNSPTASNSLGYQYTFNNVGFSQDSQISAVLYEINSTSIERGNSFFITGESYVTSFNASDLYSYVSAVIQQNPEYDYIEYYPTWSGQFLEDYINLLNAGGGDWVVVNQLDVYEQLGSNFIRTFSMTSLQETAFNAPAAFRPIIRNASLAISYTIEYTMRLLNKVNGQEIIRKATWTSTDVKKYGPILQKINVLEGFTPVKVYNKIVKLSEDNLKSSVQYVGSPTVMTQNVYVNSYYDVNYISVDSTTNLSVVLGQTVYPQGKNIIFINKFDNFVKFKIFTKSPDKKQNVSLDLSSTGMNVKLAFIFDDQSKTYIDPLQDLNAADPGAGEVLFRLDDSLTTKLLGGKQRDYYIVNKNDKGDEVLIYAGQFADQKDRNSVTSASSIASINQLGLQLSSLQSSVSNANTNSKYGAAASLNAAISKALQGGQVGSTQAFTDPELMSFITSENVSISNSALMTAEDEKIASAQSSQSVSSSSTMGITQAIISAGSTNNRRNLNVVEMPGYTPFVGSNINNAITPIVVKPSDPDSRLSYQSVSSSALSNFTEGSNS